MATFALIHGGGSTAWDWHPVAPLLERAGHQVVAVDLPIEDARNGLEDYVRVVAAAVGDRKDVIVVGHSLGGFTAPLVCDAIRTDGLVYLAAMIPLPGESFEDWWSATGHDRETIDEDDAVSFFEGVPEPLVREARARERDQQGEWMSMAWPADRHPAVATRAILAEDDRFFPAPFMRRQVRDRLGIEPIEIEGGHYVQLTAPGAVASALLDFADEIAAVRNA
ncbi:alpha/beta fold hydrolase [Aeromicrobium sp. CF4.19]|uniref:alpha/beta fold hydrolase n=1 Tax=Aeromicrobium sp. CF4.19 TaxID=3373082 RepID=UPI003EE45EA9